MADAEEEEAVCGGGEAAVSAEAEAEAVASAEAAEAVASAEEAELAVNAAEAAAEDVVAAEAAMDRSLLRLRRRVRGKLLAVVAVLRPVDLRLLLAGIRPPL